jgi:hypothetical protein
MKSVRLFGLSLLALLALGAFAAATASAEEGFLPTPKTANILGGTSTLGTASGFGITCEKLDESTITFNNEKEKEPDSHGTATLHWLGCTTLGKLVGVNSLGDKAKEILAKVLFLVCLDPTNPAGKLLANFGIAAETDEPVHLEEPSTGTLQIVTGRVIGIVLTVGPAKLWVVDFTATSQGVQAADLCIKGVETKKHTLTSEENENKKPETGSEEVKAGLIQFPSEVKLEDS